jgi:hypothetical protein
VLRGTKSDNISLDLSVNENRLNISSSFFQDGDEVNESAFLLSSWKAFLIVLSRDQPIAVSPKTCQLVVASLIKAVRGQLSSRNPGSCIPHALTRKLFF